MNSFFEKTPQTLEAERRAEAKMMEKAAQRVMAEQLHRRHSTPVAHLASHSAFGAVADTLRDTSQFISRMWSSARGSTSTPASSSAPIDLQ